MADQISWPGKSGKKYRYGIYSMETLWKSQPGNYIFAKKTSSGKWTPVYIGETDNLADRLPGHEKLSCVRRNGGTQIHAHTNSGGARARRAEEADLLANFDPPCNKE